MSWLRLIIPGRHLVNTITQEELIKHYVSLQAAQLAQILDVQWKPLGTVGKIDEIIFAVTSANHHNTKRNPLNIVRRTEQLTIFSQWLEVSTFIYPVDDKRYMKDFAKYTLDALQVQAKNEEMNLEIDPSNTIIWCSTPEVFEQYVSLWYKVIPFEYNPHTKLYDNILPSQLISKIVDSVVSWDDPYDTKEITSNMAKSSMMFYKRYNIHKLTTNLHLDKVFLLDGDITEMREYNTYARSFEEWALRKYNEIKEDILPGKIVDIGCASGWLLEQIAKDPNRRDCDLYGIEWARPLYEQAVYKKNQWWFDNDHIHFFQKNAIDNKVFPDNNIDTFITFALTHEVISYDSETKLQYFMKNIYDQLREGWRWINFDVVWPENPEEEILAKLCTVDWEEFHENVFQKNLQEYNDIINKERSNSYMSDQKKQKEKLSTYISSLSTLGRFKVFAKTFRSKQWEMLSYEDSDINWTVLIKKRDIYEFMSKKDYPDNRMSEMNERFCTYSPAERKAVIEKAWFKAKIEPVSNTWIHKNRYRDKVTIFQNNDGFEWDMIPYDATNIKIIADKM